MTGPRTIATLLAELPRPELVAGDAAAGISGVEHDSRQVGPGSLFAAVPGFNVDGHAYLRDVAAKGAAALLVQRDHRAAWQVLVSNGAGAVHAPAIIAVDDTRVALPRAAAWYYGHPAENSWSSALPAPTARRRLRTF